MNHSFLGAVAIWADWWPKKAHFDIFISTATSFPWEYCPKFF